MVYYVGSPRGLVHPRRRGQTSGALKLVILAIFDDMQYYVGPISQSYLALVGFAGLISFSQHIKRKQIALHCSYKYSYPM